MLKKLIKTMAMGVATLALAIGTMPVSAFADSGRIVTIGADLTDSQKATVLDFFGLSEDDLQNMQVITVNNQDERAYLEGTVSDAVIGTQTLSCSYIEPTTSGGINVETANLTYVTKNTLYNALQTAGIENCNLVVTAPYKVSGTGALTGIFKAYEANGKTLDDDKKEAATQEMVDTAKLENTYGEGAAQVIGDVKDQVVSSGKDMTDDQIRDIIKTAAKAKGIDLTDADIDTILAMVKRVQSLDYDKTAFSNTLDKISGQLDELNGKADGILGAIQEFFGNIVKWFQGLFGGGDSNANENANGGNSNAGILGGLNTNVFELDSGNTTENKDAASDVNAQSDGTDVAQNDAAQDSNQNADGGSSITDAVTKGVGDVADAVSNTATDAVDTVTGK